MNAALIVGLLLALKHFVADGPLQTAYQYSNKGKFLHPGGILHAAIHGGFTAVALLAVSALVVPIPFELVAGVAAAETLAHYVIDWSKVNMTKRYGWSRLSKDADGRPALCIYSNNYFIALVADQCAHFACYAVIIALFA